MKCLTSKDFGKVAFAVGLGVTLGKNVGEYINTVLDGAFLGCIKAFARRGNKVCIDACKSVNISYESEDVEKDEPKMKMGFHCD